MSVPAVPDHGILDLLGLPSFADPDLPRQIAQTETPDLLKALENFGDNFKARSEQMRMAVGCVVHTLRGRLEDGEFGPAVDRFSDLTGFAPETVKSWMKLAVPQLGPIPTNTRRDQGKGGRKKNEVRSDQISDQHIRDEEPESEPPESTNGEVEYIPPPEAPLSREDQLKAHAAEFSRLAREFKTCESDADFRNWWRQMTFEWNKVDRLLRAQPASRPLERDDVQPMFKGNR